MRLVVCGARDVWGFIVDMRMARAVCEKTRLIVLDFARAKAARG